MASPEELDAVVQRTRFTLQIDAGIQKNFTTFGEITSFMDQENAFWSPCSGSVPELWQALQSSRGSLHSALAVAPAGSVENAIRTALNSLAPSGSVFVCSESARGKFLRQLHDDNPKAVASAYAYLRGVPRMNQLQGRDAFDGVLAAALFSMPGAISSSLSAEVKAFATLRAGFDSAWKLADAEFHAYMENAVAWKADSMTQIDQLIQDKRAELEGTNYDWVKKLTATDAEWRTKMTDLEHLYTEKLRLEKPAEYWKSLEAQYAKQGDRWVCWTAAATALLITGACLLVYKPPFLLKNDNFSLSGFKGAVVIAAGTSMAIYFINLLAKLSTSSFHLSRDARERRQLTHVYLALIKDNAMSEGDRQIILGALFSRSDTGLLKHDAAPEFSIPALLAALRGGK